MSVKDALLATIDAQEGGVTGRTLLQKKLYFLSILVNEDFRFTPHYYGPFSSGVADELGALCEAALVDENPQMYPGLASVFGELRRYDYDLSESGKQVVKKRSRALQSYRDALTKINSHPIANDPNLLATAAKVHFIVNEHKRATGADIRKRARELGWDISKSQIDQVVDYLKHLDLISVH